MNKRSTFDIMFYVKRKNPRKNGALPVMCRITVNGTKSAFSCKIDTASEIWANGKANGKSDEAKKINRDLDAIKASIRNHYKNIQERDSYVTAEKVKNAFLGISMQYETLLTIYEQFNIDFDKMVKAGLRSDSTQEKYTTVYKHLKEFIKYKYKLSDIGLRDITPAFITDFEIFLRTEKGCSTNTVAVYMMPLRKMITIAQKNRVLLYDPFADYSISWEETDRGYLDSKEIKVLMTTPNRTKKQEFARDMFLFSIFTGLAFIDLFTLSENDLLRSEDGHIWVMKRRGKTDVESVVRLLEIPCQILEKYDGLGENGRVFPIKSYRNIMYHIKNVAKHCGIEKRVSWHIARHTMATEVCLTNGMSIETLSKILGHKSIKTTQIYAKVTQKKNNKDMDFLENNLRKVKDFRGVSLV